MRLLRRSSRRADDQQQQSTRGRQAVVRAPRQRSAATDNATRQGVQHGAPETLPGGQRHRAPLIPVRVVLPAKGDSLAVVVDQAVVAECDAMRVAAPGRYAREFAVNAVVGGVLVLLPLYLAVLVMLKGMQSVVVLVRPLAALFPETVPAENALALLAVLFICFVVGAAVRTRAGRVVRERMETSFFGRLPGYALFRGFTQRLAGGGDQNMWKPALAENRGCSRPRVHRRGTRRRPLHSVRASVPTPFAGAVYILRRERVHLVDIPFTEAIQSVSRWGAGSKELVAAVRREALFETQCRNDCLRIPTGVADGANPPNPVPALQRTRRPRPVSLPAAT